MLEVTPSQIYNFDETDIQFTPNLSNTYCHRGSRTIKQKIPKCSGRCTVFLGSNMDGTKCTPMLIFLGQDTKDGRIKKQLRDKRGFPPEMEYRVQHNAWMDEVGMLEWIEKIWKPIAQQHERTLLLIDTFSSHMTKNVIHELSLLNTEVDFIPKGYTGKLQPLDVGINKPFKNYMCQIYMDWMRENINSKPTREVVAQWTLQCWNRVSEEICKNAFKGAGFMTKFGGEDEDDDDNSNENTGSEENENTGPEDDELSVKGDEELYAGVGGIKKNTVIFKKSEEPDQAVYASKDPLLVNVEVVTMSNGEKVVVSKRDIEEGEPLYMYDTDSDEESGDDDNESLVE